MPTKTNGVYTIEDTAGNRSTATVQIEGNGAVTSGPPNNTNGGGTIARVTLPMFYLMIVALEVWFVYRVEIIQIARRSRGLKRKLYAALALLTALGHEHELPVVTRWNS